MKEICINEYVRTYEGIIGIVKYQDTNNIAIITNDEEIELSSGIYKNSFNIIDLIEVGDYVNGHLVVDKVQDTDDYGKDFITIEVESDLLLHKSLMEKHIKSIVTKEMMESIEYKVGD